MEEGCRLGPVVSQGQVKAPVLISSVITRLVVFLLIIRCTSTFVIIQSE